MAFMVLDGNTVSVAEGSFTYERIGDAGRSNDGQYAASYREEKRSGQFRTAPITHATANTLRGLLTGPAITASGDFCAPDASVTIVGGDFSTEVQKVAGGTREVVTFSIEEA